MTEEQVFLNALDLPNPGDRSAYLDSVCGADSDLRRQVEELLAAHFKSGEFLNEPVAEQLGTAPITYVAETLIVAHKSDEDPVPGPKKPDEEQDDLAFLQPSARPDSLGRIGHYEVLEVLGKGGFGIVFRAFDDVLQRVVALKVLAPAIAATSPARKRFLREAQASARVRHENVVQVHAVEELPIPYLVMEFIAGETLQQRLDRQGPLDVRAIVSLGRQIAEGLAAAHATGLIHRDIKPGNVLIERGSHDRVKITDFGLARAADDASMTQSGVVAGTPMFMAPEQAQGDTLDQRADLFSLGSVLYVMASGRPPFRAATTFAVLKRVVEETPRPIQDVIPETPQWLCDIIAKLHAKKPDERFQSAREVADVLGDCEEQLKQNSRLRDFSRIPRERTAPLAAKKGSGERWKWVAAAALLLPLLALAISEFTGATQLFRARVIGQAPEQPAIDTTPVATAPASPNADGWVQLFNGQDLTGWKFHSDQPGHWVVQNGILKGSKRQSHLFSERGDYKNFHLRAEVKINLGGDSGILFRAPFELRPGRPNDLGVPGCYEAELHHDRIHGRPTGSISVASGRAPPTTLGRVLDGSLTEPDEWFTYEVIAEDNHFITKINGVEAANCEDPQSRYPTGHIALQVWHSNTLVQFRKIEIKELPASSPVTDGFVALFNGKDLTGWKKHSLSGGDWRVEGGAIDGRGTTSYLFSESGDYDNFYLRVEAKINGNGDAGVCFRTPFDVKGLGQTGPAKFALLEGYEAAIAARPNWANHTGSLTTADGTVLQAGPLLPHKADEWFVLEVIAEDNRIRTLVDGKSTADFKEARRFARGHIALQTWGPNITSVQFRRIEIKQLTPLAPTPSVATQWTAAELQRIAALPAEQQVEEVRKELVRLNPQFNGVVTPKIENDAVTEISINTDEVENIAPIRALTKLVYFDCRGTYPYGGKLSDLSPLTGTTISRLDCSSTKVSDLRPLAGLPLTFLHFNHNPVSDLAPLKGMPLQELGLAETKVTDLSPLRGMKLKVLGAQLLLVTDLSPLAGMPLTGIDLYHTVGVTKLDALKGMPLEGLNLQDVPVSDLSPLAGMATLRTLVLHATQVSDLSPLAGLKLTDLILHGQPIKDLAPLKGMPLTRLHLYETGVTDLRPLEGLPLVEVRFNPKNITHGLDVLRGIKSITTIGIDGAQTWPAAEFWQRLEKEEFK